MNLNALLLPLYVIVGLVLIAFIRSFLWSVTAFQGWRRAIAIAVTAFFWVGVYWIIHGRDASRYNWERNADKTCAVEADDSFESQDIDNLVDENTVLTANSVLFLLSQNNLKSVEIRVKKSTDRNDSNAFGNGYVWQKSDVEKLYAKLELAQKGNPECIELPHGTAGSESRLPFLPDTCVKASFLDQPSARYSLEFAPAHYSDWPFMSKYGAWSIIDKQTNKKLATATTHRQKPTPIELSSPEEVLTYAPGHYTDSKYCDIGWGLIARIKSLQNPDLNNRRYLNTTHLSPQSLFSVAYDVDAQRIPIIQPKKLFKEYPKGHMSELARLDNSEKVWSNAVIRAQQYGWSNYTNSRGDYLIHWNTKEVIALEKPYSPQETWRVFSVEDGFITLPLHRSATVSSLYDVILRNASDGKLVWSARIVPSQDQIGQCTKIEPGAVYVDGADLTLTTHCSKEENGVVIREVWSIPLSSLPGPL